MVGGYSGSPIGVKRVCGDPRASLMPIVWSAGTIQDPEQPGSVVALANAAFFEPGDFIDSANGLYRLQFQLEGNLVLLELPSTVLFASGSENLGATQCLMQVDGNLVIYAGAAPLWASNTSGNEGATLVLYDSGDLAVFASGVEQIAVWSIPPDWRTGSLESLSWLSSVSESPFAVEQRMGLRLSPRQSFDFNFTIWRGTRTYFDLLLMRASGSPIYLPLWHEIEKLALTAALGATALVFPTNYTEFQTAKFAFLQGQSIHDYELVEIQSFTTSGITLVNPLQSEWPQGTRVFPVKKCKVDGFPTVDRRGDRAFQVSMRFLSLEPNLTTAVPVLNYFMDHPVIETDPNEADQLSYTYNRKMTVLDNETGLQSLYDVAPFVNQTYSWYAKSREAQSKLRGLFYLLQGRRVPVWVSTVFSDFELAAPIALGVSVMDVKRCGYTDAGGPFVNREFIVFQLENGFRYYRRIIAAALIGDGSTERISYDAALPVAVTPVQLRRISFLSFCRLDQDSIEFTHHTDRFATVNTVFRTDPGIGGVENFLQIEVDPIPPGDPDTPLVVIDPFKTPNGKLWQYIPSFGTFAGSDYVGIWWAGRRSAAELVADNPRLDIATIDDAFPPESISGSGAYVTLPLTGSFILRVRMYWNTGGWPPPDTVYWKFEFLNSFMPDIELVAAHNIVGPINTNQYSAYATQRREIAPNLLDPEVPMQIHISFKFVGGVLLFPACNPTGDCTPYHGNLSTAGGGDAAFVIEWYA